MTVEVPDHFLTFREIDGGLVAINRFSISCVAKGEDGHTNVWMQSLNKTDEKGQLRVVLQEPQSEVVRMFEDAASEMALSRMSSKLVEVPASFSGEPTAVCPSAIALVKERKADVTTRRPVCTLTFCLHTTQMFHSKCDHQ